MQRPEQRRRCTASRSSSSNLAAIFAVLVTGCSQAPLCDALQVPIGAPTGILGPSTLVQQVGQLLFSMGLEVLSVANVYPVHPGIMWAPIDEAVLDGSAACCFVKLQA